MAATESFAPFRKLPAELRIQIWTEALTVPSIWAVALNNPKNVHDGGPPPHRRSIRMTCVGTSPHLVGLSCKQAREVMERIYKSPLRGPIMEATVAGVYWIYLERAVITFVNSQDSLAILDRFGAEISRFQHVALVWENWRTHPLTCVRLANSCPALRTLVVQRVDAETSRTWVSSLLRPSTLCEKVAPVVLELDAATAAYYVALAMHEGPEIGAADSDTLTYRKSILQYFGQSLPRLHILSPGEIAERGASADASLSARP
ncbi:hypothetical protein NKR19_g794 [Coniochaeta hoffmannii]|uniref:2EXR domain-containing protein n=1 Tax=Coniochaeta hoffmannii TaxID=91930 RepID=A0AA38VTK2_9PEZI|nr:hypothetical protein NKR19_g794 [Coniochaeta hoffmannii]